MPYSTRAHRLDCWAADQSVEEVNTVNVTAPRQGTRDAAAPAHFDGHRHIYKFRHTGFQHDASGRHQYQNADNRISLYVYAAASGYENTKTAASAACCRMRLICAIWPSRADALMPC